MRGFPWWFVFQRDGALTFPIGCGDYYPWIQDPKKQLFLKWEDLFPIPSSSYSIYFRTIDIYWLVVYLPLWKIWVRQMGVLFPIYGKNVPNHQYFYIYICIYIYISLTIPGDPTQELSTRSALCELNRAFGSCHSGDASGSGSRSKTSRTMPLKRSLCRSRAAWAGLAAPGWKRRRPRNPTGWGPRKRVRVNRCLKKVAEIDWVKVYGYGRYRYS